jgi:hypothetical protein
MSNRVGATDASRAFMLPEKMLKHFLAGKPAPVRVDLTREVERNPRLRELLASRIETEIEQRLSGGEPLQRMIHSFIT